jgi:succinate dehydrogenase / fumarate reductase iron-sulfur subunit
MKLLLGVARFNPESDKNAGIDEYIVDWEQHETVLDVLFKAWHQDPSLSFRRSCRSGICGSCAMYIQDKPRLACQTLVANLIKDNGSLTLKPLPGFRRVKDLVVDLDPFFDALKSVIPWVLTIAEHNGLMKPEDSWLVESPATCILCGICDAGITVASDIRPAALVKNIRMAVDPRDSLGTERIKLAGLTEEGLNTFKSLLQQICPKRIEIPVIWI